MLTDTQNVYIYYIYIYTRKGEQASKSFTAEKKLFALIQNYHPHLVLLESCLLSGDYLDELAHGVLPCQPPCPLLPSPIKIHNVLVIQQFPENLNATQCLP